MSTPDHVTPLLPAGVDPAGPEPGVDDPTAQLAWQFAQQARACEVTGSPLYAGLLARLVRDLVAGGVTRELTLGRVAPGRGNAVALRFMAALHRLALTGAAPELAASYPSTGGSGRIEEAWAAVREVLADRAELVAEHLDRPCQTNEPGRSAALIIGLLTVAAATDRPLALFEIGTAAGLNLRLDRFHYGGGGRSWGDPASPVDLRGHWVDVPAPPVSSVDVVARRGVDRAPLDPTTQRGRLALESAVWADQVDRLERLQGAIALAERVPADIEQGDAAAWVERVLRPHPGRTTVLMHSVVEEYLDPADRDRVHARVRSVGEAGSRNAPVAWIRLEPVTAERRHGLTVTTWPGGDDRFLGTCGSLGADVRRP